MTLSVPRTRHYLETFAFEKLFIEELGWDRFSKSIPIQFDSQNYTLSGVAEKRGVQIFICRADSDGKVPDYPIRRKIEKQLTKSAYEHLIIFVDSDQSIQIWQWVSRQPGQPASCREHTYYPRNQSGDLLIQKLESIAFTLNEEEGLTLAGVVFRLRDSFDRDRVTKKFYDHFKKEHKAFFDFIEGLLDQGDREWYASLMLNRLMFVYFIQCKGFLDNDTNYLRNRLKMVQEHKGKDKFLTFYRYFLRRLFHEGFSQQPTERAPDLEKLLGYVPYLNGGLFELHELEQKYPDIDIPDDAFERLFTFFDKYEWHLDTRPISKGNEINPDVLGYIFEKYINQKQMGAYYTKEDITEYISKNTVIPCLFDMAKKKCSIAFQPDSALWSLLANNPDRYIHSAVRKGIIGKNGEIIPLPEDIEKGSADIYQREKWNNPAEQEYALPTETWREYIERRNRCLNVRENLSTREIHNIDDLVTYNLDIRQLAEDAIIDCEGPELLRAFYKALSTVTILDPTCGSGAFLFAALNILEPLYEACLDRMQAFVDDLDRSGESQRPEKFSDFRKILDEVLKHPNRKYFILKSIIINNLYGVDIMQEAAEICKLRLFLKLVAQVDKVKQLEPLPDIDFNIRAGNTLIGFTSFTEVKESMKGNWIKLAELPKIQEEAELVEKAFVRFHEMQTTYDMISRDFIHEKKELSGRLKKLRTELDHYLARVYNIDPSNKKGYEQWEKTHIPFHWVVEFYNIIKMGGFDVIIGNPPYVEYGTVKSQYQIKDYRTEKCGNLYAFTWERCLSIITKKSRIGLILPISSVSTPRMLPLMELFKDELVQLHVSNFAVRPSKLFMGADMNISIILGKQGTSKNKQSTIYSTGYNRWYSDFRSYLFFNLKYAKSEIDHRMASIPKISTNLEMNLVTKLLEMPNLMEKVVDKKEKSEIVFYHSGGRYFRKCIKEQLSNEYKELRLEKGWSDAVICILSSSLYYWLWISMSDCYHVTKRDIQFAPINDSLLKDTDIQKLSKLLLNDLWKNASIRNRTRADGSIQKEVNFNVGKSKSIIDLIDRKLATHFNLSREELEFILSFDSGFRFNEPD